MTKSQAGIAVVAAALLAGAGGLGYHCLQREQPVVPSPQVVPGSPRGVVYELLKGMQEGEGDRIRRALYAQDEHEAEAIVALTEYSAASSRLVKLCDATYGFGRLRAPGLPLSRTGLEAQVAQLNEIVDEDLADVDLNPNASPSIFHLRKIDGRWWVMVRRTFEPTRSEETGPLSQMIEGLRVQAGVYASVSRDIEAGRLASLESAQFAINRQLAEAFRTSWYNSIWARNPAGLPLPATPPDSAPEPVPAPAKAEERP